MIKTPKFNDIFAAHDNAEKMASFAHVVWAEGVADLEGRSLVTKARLHTLDRYVRLRTEYEFLYPVAMHQGPTKVSDNGNHFANMNWSSCLKLCDQIEKLEKNLLISPLSCGADASVKNQSIGISAASEFMNGASAH